MKIGKRIRELREKTGLSQSAAAKGSRISQGYLSQLENDDVANPSWSIITRLARAFNITAVELTGEEVPEVSLHPAMQKLLVGMSLPQQGSLAELMEVLRATD
jgi:transcriptional regulator with XRE-family HTH domain